MINFEKFSPVSLMEVASATGRFVRLVDES